jgi:hypothetical protein
MSNIFPNNGRPVGPGGRRRRRLGKKDRSTYSAKTITAQMLAWNNDKWSCIIDCRVSTRVPAVWYGLMRSVHAEVSISLKRNMSFVRTTYTAHYKSVPQSSVDRGTKPNYIDTVSDCGFTITDGNTNSG